VTRERVNYLRLLTKYLRFAMRKLEFMTADDKTPTFAYRHRGAPINVRRYNHTCRYRARLYQCQNQTSALILNDTLNRTKSEQHCSSLITSGVKLFLFQRKIKRLRYLYRNLIRIIFGLRIPRSQ